MRLLRLSAALLLTLCLAPSLSAEIVDRIVAIINDDIVTLKEVERYVRVEQEGRFVSVNEYFRNIRISERIDTFIDDVLIRQQAKKLKIEVSDREVSQIVDNMKKQSLVTDEQFREQLQKEGISYEEFADGVRMNLLRNRLLSRVISPEVNVTEAMMREYFEKHKDELRGQELRLQQIFVPGQRPDAEQRIKAAYELLKQGKPFEEVAKQYSDDPSAAQGGDLGLVRTDEMIPVLRDALSQIKPGSFTPVVRAPYGYHILKLNEVRQGDPLPYDALKEVIQERVVQEESMKRYREYVDKLRKASYVEVKI